MTPYEIGYVLGLQKRAERTPPMTKEAGRIFDILQNALVAPGFRERQMRRVLGNRGVSQWTRTTGRGEPSLKRLTAAVTRAQLPPGSTPTPLEDKVVNWVAHRGLFGPNATKDRIVDVLRNERGRRGLYEELRRRGMGRVMSAGNVFKPEILQGLLATGIGAGVGGAGYGLYRGGKALLSAPAEEPAQSKDKQPKDAPPKKDQPKKDQPKKPVQSKARGQKSKSKAA